jgi:hypothetical protein
VSDYEETDWWSNYWGDHMAETGSVRIPLVNGGFAIVELPAKLGWKQSITSRRSKTKYDQIKEKNAKNSRS